MTELLQSIKTDLLSRRFLPSLIALALALIVALAYAAIGGGAATPASRPVSTPTAAVPTGAKALPVSAAPANPNQAVSETPGGTRYQSRGATRNPFTPLPSPPAKKAAATGSSGSKSAAGKSGGTGSSKSGAGETTHGSSKPQPAPTKPATPKSVYSVSALFGLAPVTPGQAPTLTPYENLKRLEELPSAKQPLLVFLGVTTTGKGAVFALDVPPILHGPGVCLPSATQCQALDMAVGQTEELEYLGLGGQVEAFQLKLVSIVKSQKAPTVAEAIYRRQSKAGRRALGQMSLPILDHMRFSLTKGVLVYSAPHKRR